MRFRDKIMRKGNVTTGLPCCAWRLPGCPQRRNSRNPFEADCVMSSKSVN